MALTAFRCSECGCTTFPRHSRCPKCKGITFTEVELAEGKLVTFTELTATRPGFRKPLRLGVAEFQNGVRALGQIAEGEPKLGMRVEVSEGELSERDGIVSRGPRFVAVE